MYAEVCEIKCSGMRRPSPQLRDKMNCTVVLNTLSMVYKKHLKILTSPVSKNFPQMGLVVGAYLLLNFVRILHSVFLKISLFFYQFEKPMPQYHCVRVL